MEKYNSYASEQTLGPSRSWTEMNDETRLAVVKDFFEKNKNQFKAMIKILEAKIDGQVVVSFIEPVGPALRGTILLDLEELLKYKIEIGRAHV